MSSEITFPYLYANYTMSFYDYLLLNPNFISENLKFGNTTQTIAFHSMLKAYWCEYEINGETIPLFEMRLLNKFNQIRSYWYNKISTYEEKYNITLLDGYTETIIENITENETSNIESDDKYYDLPNKSTESTYVSNQSNNVSSGNNDKEHSRTYTRNGSINQLTQLNDYLDKMQNIYLDFIKEFKSCFIQLFS